MSPSGPLHFISSTFKISKCTDPVIPPSAPSSEEPLHLFTSLSTWELLNLMPETILAIPDRLQKEYQISPTFLEEVMAEYIVQSTGMEGLKERWGFKESPKFLMAGTKHYSWPKGLALTGVGSQSLLKLDLDSNARISLSSLQRTLDHCLNEHIPIYGIVAVIGTTEDGAVDPLAKIIEVKEEYRKKGLSFLVHADAAWGGYFASTLREPPASWVSSWPTVNPGDKVPFDEEYVPYMALKQYTVHQLEALKYADSVTIDPHKSGYCPYPAGGLCYKDRRMRHLLTWSAPYIEHGKRGENIGVHGVEGSKPGAAAAAVFMHHNVVGLHKRGHGGLLGEVSFTCARLAAHWATLSTPSDPFIVVPFNRLRSERQPSAYPSSPGLGSSPELRRRSSSTFEEPNLEAIEAEKAFIREKIIGRSNEELVKDPDPEIVAELRSLGSDLNINTFICNFRLPHSGIGQEGVGPINEDVSEANYLNELIFDALSPSDVGVAPKRLPLFLSATVLKHSDYGECLDNFKRRAGLEAESKADLFVLRNVVMSPFQANAKYVQEVLMAKFKEVLHKALKTVITRNTVTPDVHTFIMQGTDRLFLAYRPFFFKANGRQQLILEVPVPSDANQQESGWSAYRKARKENPNALFTLKTSRIRIDELLHGGCKCDVYVNDDNSSDLVSQLTIRDVRIVKNRPLLSRWQDPDYDAHYTPFYLYGTSKEQHVDHMLLKAPNAQLTAERVRFTDLDRPLPEDKLASGLLMYIHRPERSMQPFDRDNHPKFFYPNASFPVTIVDDPFAPTAHGPGLASALSHKHPVVARGTVHLPLNVFTDSCDLNRQDFRDYERITEERMKDRMTWEDKSMWRSMVKERLHLVQEEYYSDMHRGKAEGKYNDGRDITRWPLSKDRTPDKDDDVLQGGLFTSNAGRN
ncbi:group II decarboxylase [Coprinopsis cinerea AmutBmut pab1-1]|nr:group II decarboxylase [Coprinopsis cinerea AmutBmut pab1-1]